LSRNLYDKHYIILPIKKEMSNLKYSAKIKRLFSRKAENCFRQIKVIFLLNGRIAPMTLQSQELLEKTML
ncbi:MAG: hypothetical protein N0E48_22110, partial [Candidatus Thiodiazotropha endolucinida]|nr:hypothetical protein [Candidatus Thiodiazotropha taylori]MCW4346031.1 hypothetical protein [Candidatus Thiodiazotropha endolucinida]